MGQILVTVRNIWAARRGRRAAGLLILAALPHAGWADRLTLSDGTSLPGRVSRVDAEGVEWVHCGARRTFLRAAIRSIDFGPVEEGCGSREADSPLVLGPGVQLRVKPSRPIDLAREPIDQIFAGSIQEPVVQGDVLVIRREAPVLLQLRSAQLHITDIRLDHGWVHIDAPADDARTALPSDATIVFTLRRPQTLRYSVRDGYSVQEAGRQD